MISNNVIQILIFLSYASACGSLYSGPALWTPFLYSPGLTAWLQFTAFTAWEHCQKWQPPFPGLAFQNLQDHLWCLPLPFTHQIQRTQWRTPDNRDCGATRQKEHPFLSDCMKVSPLPTSILGIKLHCVQWLKCGGYSNGWSRWLMQGKIIFHRSNCFQVNVCTRLHYHKWKDDYKHRLNYYSIINTIAIHFLYNSVI